MKDPVVGEAYVKQAVVLDPNGDVSVDETMGDRDNMVILQTSVEAMLAALLNTGTRPSRKDPAMSALVKAKMAAILRETAEILSAAAISPKGYTIYFNGTYGIAKAEAKSIEEVTSSSIDFVAKGGRRVKTIMTYYSPFILVVEGLNLPDPADPFAPAETGANGVTTQRGRMNGTDPRWVSELLESLPNLKEVVKFTDGKLVLNKVEAETTPAKVTAASQNSYLGMLESTLASVSTPELENLHKDLLRLKKESNGYAQKMELVKDSTFETVDKVASELEGLEDEDLSDASLKDTIKKLRSLTGYRAADSVLSASSSTMSAAVLPSVNGNGTDQAELLKGYQAAVSAVRALMTALDDCWPNARDYEPGDYAKARAEHQLWQKQAKEMGIELYEIVDAIESAKKQPGRFS